MDLCCEQPGPGRRGSAEGRGRPYPALVSIGWDAAGRLVLIDLEHVGILHLAGDADFARHVLQAIAVELASTPLPGHLEVTALGDTTPGLDGAAPERVARIDGIAAATTDISSHTADQRRALASVGANSLRVARPSDDAGGAWTPHILLAQELPDDDHVKALFDALTDKPRAAGAVITSSTHTEAHAEAWTLECQSPDTTIMLPGSNLPITLQGLSDPHFADAIELLTLAASDSDVPAPDWTRTDPDDDNAEEDAPREEPGEDGLPAEYAELEQEALSDDDDADTGESAATGDPQDRNKAPAPAPTDDLIKTDTDGNTQTEDAAPAAGPSLAEVLAAEDDGPEPHIPTASSPASGRADVVLAPATPCAAPAPPAVHVTIPAPSTEPEPPATPLSEPAATDGPAVLVLGPISIEGATGRIDSNRVRTATELVTYLALNSGVDHHAIDDALWPGQIVNKTMRNAVISRARSWLGKDPDANAYFPRVQDTGDNRYRLGAAVTCDWTRFQRFARTGLARYNEDGDLGRSPWSAAARSPASTPSVTRGRNRRSRRWSRRSWTSRTNYPAAAARPATTPAPCGRPARACSPPRRAKCCTGRSSSPTTLPATSTPCVQPPPGSHASTSSWAAVSTWKRRPLNSCVTYSLAPSPEPGEGRRNDGSGCPAYMPPAVIRSRI
nr:hypothetical protein OG781_01490 [Streptomyces sp. NBC_00830]WTB35658.1 hypothetical protein OG781_45090 [Streptomyces sp. NBC_00830]